MPNAFPVESFTCTEIRKIASSRRMNWIYYPPSNWSITISRLVSKLSHFSSWTPRVIRLCGLPMSHFLILSFPIYIAVSISINGIFLTCKKIDNANKIIILRFHLNTWKLMNCFATYTSYILILLIDLWIIDHGGCWNDSSHRVIHLGDLD